MRRMTVSDRLPDRLDQLNTKAYYLLVALSFLYGHKTPTFSIKAAIALTAVAAVLPLQDYVRHSLWKLQFIRWFKVAVLTAAFCFTWHWLWS